MTQRMNPEQLDNIFRGRAQSLFTEIEDVANAVEFFLGCNLNNMTGTVLTVNVGSTD
jgi:hypothetical protein